MTFYRIIFIFIFTSFPAQGQQASYHSTYSSLRQGIVKLIKKADKRIYVTTGLFTDGTIANELYLAKFRKVQVHVLVNKDNLTNPLSIVNYLMNRGILVSKKRQNTAPSIASAILSDNKLALINANFDFRSKSHKYKIKYISQKIVNRFIDAFKDSSLPVSQKENKNLQAKKIHVMRRSVSTSSKQEYYNYDRIGVGKGYRKNQPQKLPKTPLYLKKVIKNHNALKKGN